jgi:hypothetical protein
MISLVSQKKDVGLIADVLDVYVFDKNDKLIASLETLTKSEVTHSTDYSYLSINDISFNIDLFKFMNGQQEDRVNDFKDHLYNYKKEKDEVIIDVGGDSDMECKLILDNWIIDPDTEAPIKTLRYEVPNAKLINKFKFENSTIPKAASFKYDFEISPFDYKNHRYRLHIINGDAIKFNK